MHKSPVLSSAGRSAKLRLPTKQEKYRRRMIDRDNQVLLKKMVNIVNRKNQYLFDTGALRSSDNENIDA